MRIINKKYQHGFLAIAAVVLIVILGFVGLTAAYLMTSNVMTNQNQLVGMQAFYVAESGLERSVRLLLHPTVADRSSCASLGTNISLSSGEFDLLDPPGSGLTTSFSVVGTPSITNPSATLTTGNLSSSSSTIPVVSTAGYAARGYIQIDREVIQYGNITATNFINLTRGADGSAAVGHFISAPVTQLQCDFTVAGTISNSGGQLAKRQLHLAVPLQDGWVVGNKPTGATSQGTALHWNRPTELAFTSINSNVTQHLNSVYVLSSADAWAVGNSGVITHWNGSTWTASTSGISNDINGVYCNNSNDCWAVGNTGKILHWDGSSWTNWASPVSVALNSVYCNNTTDCWAVGATSTGDVMIHGTGISPFTWVRDASRPTPANTLNSVYCADASNCWAVGNSGVIIRWNGTAWSASSSAAATLRGVYCNDSNDCWAVGNANSSNLLIMRWNGSAWSRVLPSAIVNKDLWGVSCARVNDCWAAGQTGTLEHWNGTSWVQTSSITTQQLNSLSFVSPHAKPWSNWYEVF